MASNIENVWSSLERRKGSRGPLPKTIEERVAAKIIIDENGCHVWQGGVDEKGYPKMGVGSSVDGTRRMKRVHVILWEEKHGKIPKGMVRHHLCENRRCVNIEHLMMLRDGDHSIVHDSAGHARESLPGSDRFKG